MLEALIQFVLLLFGHCMLRLLIAELSELSSNLPSVTEARLPT